MKEKKAIKRYRISLKIGVRSIVLATHYTQEVKGTTRFYMDEQVVASFATVSVAGVEELGSTVH